MKDNNYSVIRNDSFDLSQSEFPFETILVMDGSLVFLKEHLDRLYDNIKMNFPDSIATFVKKDIVKKELLSFVNNIDKEDDEYFRLPYYGLRVLLEENKVIISLRGVPKRNAILNLKDISFEKKLIVKDEVDFKNERFYKLAPYKFHIARLKQIRDLGFFEGLLLDENGYILSGLASNFFFVDKGEIYTPKLNKYILDGVVRKKLIENMNIKYSYCHISDILNKDYFFFTNSLIGIIIIIKENVNNYSICDIIKGYRLLEKGNYENK